MKISRAKATHRELQAYRLHEASQNFHTIGTHADAHADEAVAIMFLSRSTFGKKLFPGIENAKIVLGFNDQGLPAIEWAKKGVILVGTGDANPFNEHATKSHPGFSHECAASLVAKYLDIDHLPFVQQVMRYALFTDTKGDLGFCYEVPGDSILVPNRFLPASLLKTFYRVAKPSPEMKLLRFCNLVEDFFSVYRHDYLLHREGKKAFQQGKIVWEGKAKLSQRELARRRKNDPKAPAEDSFKVFFVRSDSEFVLPYALFVDKKIGIIIQRQSTGHFQIHRNNRYQIHLTEVAAVLRRMTQDAKGEVKTTGFHDLKKHGIVPGAEEIYFDEERTGSILNGSVTHPDIPPSRLTDEAIITAVKIGLGEYFHRQHAKRCQVGICSHKNGSWCDWYRYGLSRCISVRKNMYVNGNGKNR